jgi:hypothetical protein
MARKIESRAKPKVLQGVCLWKKTKKDGFLAQEWYYSFFLMGGGILFSGCDQIQEFLGMGSDDEPDPPPPRPTTEMASSTSDEDDDNEYPRFVLEGNQWYEVHIFKTAGSYTLSFGDPVPENVTADVLIVGGGGGSGGHRGYDKSGGGGAGGLLYKTGVSLVPEGNPKSLTGNVGADGWGGALPGLSGGSGGGGAGDGQTSDGIVGTSGNAAGTGGAGTEGRGHAGGTGGGTSGGAAARADPVQSETRAAAAARAGYRLITTLAGLRRLLPTLPYLRVAGMAVTARHPPPAATATAVP